MSFEEILQLKDFVFEKKFGIKSNCFVLCVLFNKND